MKNCVYFPLFISLSLSHCCLYFFLQSVYSKQFSISFESDPSVRVFKQHLRVMGGRERGEERGC